MNLSEQVRQCYSHIAEDPTRNAPFVVGRALAEALNYPIDQLPAVAVEAFCGVANLSVQAHMDPDDLVLDLGCGSGTDTLLAARRSNRVVGIDFSRSMLSRAREAVELAGLARNVFLLHSQAHQLPLLDASVDVALANGLFNLNPQRQEIFAELARVLRADGRVYAAELILNEPIHTSDPIDWFR
ncbi:MAG: methyltransferase domain-containing protein [Candidatus Eremiobacteraeota bacterium]|nr:methyltransferase domain-containing protein [Candidatus Eremiobacteraeota bacterium]MCW5871489.1 methyltransferase domain-containing protein [Candidatus Eremiobacteraeota bacterium]